MTALTLHGKTRIGALDLHIDIAINQGETLAVLGPNGAGKSSLLRIINGLLPLTSGALTIDGQIVDQPSTHTFVAPHLRRVGWVPQDRLLFSHLTVAQNIGFSPRSTPQRVTNLMEALNISTLAEQLPTNCSGGQAQRVALARALASHPTLLLLDEPSTALDAESQRLIGDALRELKEVTVILVTHDLDEVTQLADHTATFSDGVLKQ